MILLGGSYNFHEFSSHGSYVLIPILKKYAGMEEIRGDERRGSEWY